MRIPVCRGWHDEWTGHDALQSGIHAIWTGSTSGAICTPSAMRFRHQHPHPQQQFPRQPLLVFLLPMDWAGCHCAAANVPFGGMGLYCSFSRLDKYLHPNRDCEILPLTAFKVHASMSGAHIFWILWKILNKYAVPVICREKAMGSL